MKKIFWFSLSILPFCFLWMPPQKQAQKPKRPNIIYIYADDLGYGEIGAYGQEKIKTPYLDQLAQEGIRFTQHYSSAPVCAPSRCMLLTGKHPGHSYIRGNYELGEFSDDREGGQMPLPEGTFTIGHMLQAQGYRTGIIGKWGLGMHNTTGSPNRQGFDYAYGYLCQKQAHNYYPTHLWENGRWDSLDNPSITVHQKLKPETPYEYFIGKEYAVDRMTAKALEFIRRKQKEPFFLYLAFPLPHLALQVPEKALAPYRGQFEESPYLGDKGYCPQAYPLSAYAGMISYLDQQVGLVMETLKALNLDEETLVLFSSDNGAAFDVGGVNTGFFNSTQGLRGLKMDLYEGGIRVPFIARWPGKIAAGQVSEHLSVQYDLMATLADLLKIKPPKNDGISYLPTLLGQKQAQANHPCLYWEYPEKNGQLALRMGEWKAIKLDMKTNPNAAWELYNLAKDRTESKNLAAERPDLLKKADALVQEFHVPAHVKDWEFVNPKFKR
jgi:arylsulfatase A-like enzyme